MQGTRSDQFGSPVSGIRCQSSGPAPDVCQMFAEVHGGTVPATVAHMQVCHCSGSGSRAGAALHIRGSTPNPRRDPMLIATSSVFSTSRFLRQLQFSSQHCFARFDFCANTRGDVKKNSIDSDLMADYVLLLTLRASNNRFNVVRRTVESATEFCSNLIVGKV